MPSDSHTPKKRTASTSTNVTSPSSNTTPDPVASICALSSGRESAWTRPINLMVVRCSSRIVSIFRVTPNVTATNGPWGNVGITCSSETIYLRYSQKMLTFQRILKCGQRHHWWVSISSAICDGPLIAPRDIQILAMSRRSKELLESGRMAKTEVTR
jgi:hypothetical protein